MVFFIRTPEVRNSHIPGAAIVILEITTCVIPLFAARLEFPMNSPFSSYVAIPLVISLNKDEQSSINYDIQQSIE